jgi:hypothetical protein
VLFTVMPRAGLPTGTEVRNHGVIAFDANPPVETPAWLNTLDSTLPESQVLALAPVKDSTRFAVRWAAGDTTADVRDYTIMVAEDSSEYRPWRQNVTATTDTFAAEPGRRYAFYSIARDSSGNLEAAPPAADASTRVAAGVTAVGEAATLRLALAGAWPNPSARGLRVSLTLPSRAPAMLELLDVSGRRVLRRDLTPLGPGQHVVELAGERPLSPGVYIVRLTQAGRRLTAKAAVLK